MVHPSLLYLQSRGTGERQQAIYQLMECLAKIKRNLSFNFFKHLEYYINVNKLLRAIQGTRIERRTPLGMIFRQYI